ncbi:slipin family protein [Spongiimicrobium salis]|uniref:slipin family protein n=1 Tax=Spongiimicrobium salis TaxID=1667022 RepID=UPI00374D75FC
MKRVQLKLKRVRINAGKVGLVFKRGDYQKVLTSGTHWIGYKHFVMVYDLTKQFVAPIALELLLQDKNLDAMLHVLEVKDNELLLVSENGNLKKVLSAGRYVYWKTLINLEFLRICLGKIYITEQFNKALFTHPELSPYLRTFEVASYEKAMLFVDDVYTKILDGGTYRFWRNDTSIKIARADMRQLQLEIAGQELLTKDKAAIRINFYTQYKIVDIEASLLVNKDYEKQLYVALQLALRSYIGQYSLDELLEQKEQISKAVLQNIVNAAEGLGVEVLHCGIRDIILTGEMKTIMNQVLVAQKKAQANSISRREETAATRSLLNTAKLMEENEMLFRLKEMEYVEKIADKIGEISVSGNGSMVTQLKEIFSVNT